MPGGGLCEIPSQASGSDEAKSIYSIKQAHAVMMLSILLKSLCYQETCRIFDALQYIDILS